MTQDELYAILIKRGIYNAQGIMDALDQRDVLIRHLVNCLPTQTECQCQGDNGCRYCDGRKAAMRILGE